MPHVFSSRLCFGAGMVVMLAVCSLVCASCADDEAQGELPTPVTLELGTGESSFEPLTAGQRVQMVAGTQGGFHVWLSLRTHGFSSDRLRMQLALSPAAPAPLAASDLSVSFEVSRDPAQAASGSREHVGWPAQLLSPWCAVDKPLSMQATVSDLQGHSASASIEIVPTAPAHGFPQSCATP